MPQNVEKEKKCELEIVPQNVVKEKECELEIDKQNVQQEVEKEKECELEIVPQNVEKEKECEFEIDKQTFANDDANDINKPHENKSVNGNKDSGELDDGYSSETTVIYETPSC